MLFSPPRTPSYNGSIEAAIGSLKTRTERRAAAAGQPGCWTTDLVEAARREANASHPRRLHGATPNEVWHNRSPLRLAEHDAFLTTLAQLQRQARDTQGLPPLALLSRNDQAAVDRLAIPRALVAHDLLLFRRKTIPAPITRLKVAETE